jgi:hypothetical protein
MPYPEASEMRATINIDDDLLAKAIKTHRSPGSFGDGARGVEGPHRT